jgi:Carbohydrate binding domain
VAYTGLPDWKLYNFKDVGNDGEYALGRFERKGVLLPQAAYDGHISIVSDCTPGGTNNAYCSQATSNANVDGHVCSPGFVQVSYDRCCETATSTNCEYPYSMTEAPTPSPAQTAAPTSPSLQILENGDFEFGLCPWTGSWGVGFTLETSIVSKGQKAAKITGRTQFWEGLRQNVFGKLQIGAPYHFQGSVYILNSRTDNRISVKLHATYDTSTGSCGVENSYHTVYDATGVRGGAWHRMSKTSYALSRSMLQPSCTLVDLALYVESWQFTFDFIVDDMSMIRETPIVI